MELAIVIGRLIQEVVAAIVEAVETRDVEAMRKVVDVLPPGSTLTTEAVLALERAKTEDALRGQG